jgi:EXLDI family protein
VPNKTIYVSDDDLPLFERAQELAAGNLSAAIAQALRERVRAAEIARCHQYDAVTVSVGSAGRRRRKRFTALCLARWQGAADASGSVEALVAYRTARGRIAVHRSVGLGTRGPSDSRDAEAGRFAERPGGGAASAAADAERLDDATEASLEVYDTLGEFAPHVPPEFASLVADAIAALDVEDLDI